LHIRAYSFFDVDKMIFPAIALLLAAVAECSPQFGGLLGGNGGWRKVSSKFVKPKYRPDAKREIVRFGPLELYAKSASKGVGSAIAMDPNGQAGVVTLSEGICTKCSILSARFLLTYEDGREASPANQVYIHHFVSYDATKMDKAPFWGCNGGFPGAGASFIDRGEDSGDTDTIFTAPNGKIESGFHMDSGSLLVQYDMVNYSEQTKKIYVNLEYEYRTNQNDKDAGHTLKSVTCNGAIPPRVSTIGSAVTTSPSIYISSNNTLVWARGHLHSGGVKMVMNIDGKTVCTSYPTYAPTGVITNMSLCPDLIPLKAGSYMTISSEYDLTKHKLREATSGHGGAQGKLGGSDVMGMFAFSYAQ